MDSSYSFIELADKHLLLGYCNGNATDVKRYKEKNPNQKRPNCHTFLSVDPQF
jgi:hypothetical protein